MKKTKPRLYILPGWGQRVSDENYQKIISLASRYEFTPLRVSTRNRRFSLGSSASFKRIVQDIGKQIARPCHRDVILGFSVGALQAYQLATSIKFGKVLICSISTMLGSDLSSVPKNCMPDLSWSQYREMTAMKYTPLVNKKVIILYGENESSILKSRSMKIGKRLGCKVIKIKRANHVMNSLYIDALRRFL